MTPIPTFTLNNGVKVPAIGRSSSLTSERVLHADDMYHVGLGCWSGFTAEEHTAGYNWMLSAVQVSYQRSHFQLTIC